MTAFVQWYFVVELIGLVTLPLTWRLFRRLPDRGYGLSKTLGILLVGFTLWVGTAYSFLRNELGGALMALLAVGAFSFGVGWPGVRASAGGKRPLVEWLRGRLAHLIAAELLFLLTFGGWALVRAHSPEAMHTEQPMDLLFLSAIWASPTYPLQDPWLAGYPISYYYFGYWLLMTVARLAGQLPEIAYNLGQACWFALLLTGCYALGFNLAVLSRREGSGQERRRWGAIGGLLTSLGVAVISNYQGVLDALGLGTSSPLNAWWWPASRVVHDVDLLGRPLEVIDEFPFFSYLLGDDHPHLLAMPFLLLVVGLCLALLLTRGESHSRGSRLLSLRGFTDFGHRVPLGPAGLVLVIVSVGALLALNTWDFPVALLLLVVASGVGHPRRGVALGVIVALGAVTAYLPYLLSAQSQVKGVLPNLFHPTSAAQITGMFGLFLPGLTVLLWLGLATQRPGWSRIRWSVAAALGVPGLSLAVGTLWALGTSSGRRWLDGVALPPGAEAYLPFILERWRGGWPTLGVGAALVALACASSPLALGVGGIQSSGQMRFPSRRDAALRFVLLLTAVGLSLLLIPEIAYLADSFGTRMNTVFKLYYQAWLLLGISAAYGTVEALSRGGVARRLGVVSLAVLGSGLIYPVVAVRSRTQEFRSGPPTLDALAYVATADTDELAAIRWVRLNTRPDSRLVQGLGTSYRADQCRISVATGRATLLGWEGHELQWRGAAFTRQAEGRVSALREIYGKVGAEMLRQALERWRVDYVYVGPRERAQYGIDASGEGILARVMELAFQHGEVRIYRRRG
jgi:YYY domain-containing protein